MDIYEDELNNIELSGVDPKDYPDFCDAYISYCEINERSATDNELDYINENFGDLINCMAQEQCVSRGDFFDPYND
jgi:hypothetical protein